MKEQKLTLKEMAEMNSLPPDFADIIQRENDMFVAIEELCKQGYFTEVKAVPYRERITRTKLPTYKTKPLTTQT